MAFIYHTFTYQGGSSGCTEIAGWMRTNFPDMFGSYTVSGNDLTCKIGDTNMLTMNNTIVSGSFGAGFRATSEGFSRSFNSGNQAAYTNVVADTDAQVVAFLSGGGGHPIITLCKNEDGDTCGIALLYMTGNYIALGAQGTVGSIQNERVAVYNFTRNTYQLVPVGFGATEQNVVCGYPLMDAGYKKIQNVWVGGSSALRILHNPIEISVDGVIYCSINYGRLLIK